MKCELKMLGRGTAAALWLLLAGCGGGGSDSEAVVELETPPAENPDKSLVEEPPVIEYLYVQGVDEVSGRTRTFQANPSSGSRTTEMEFPTAHTILRPRVALNAERLTLGYSVLVTDNGVYYLPPDDPTIRRLSTLNGPFSADHVRTYLHGITRANAGIQVRTPGSDGSWETGDDQFWQIPLTATANQPAQEITEAMYEGTPILDGSLNHLGFIRAGADAYVEIFDTQGKLLHSTNEIADGPVYEIRLYDGNQAVLTIGNSLYLVDVAKLLQGQLPPPAYEATQPLDADGVRLDDDRLYLTDADKLVALDYTGSTIFTWSDASYTQLSFQSAEVFTRDFVVLVGINGTNADLIAVSKDPGTLSHTPVEANPFLPKDDLLGSAYLATDNYLYFSREELGRSDAGFQARVWENTDQAGLMPYSQYDLARWYFYEDVGRRGRPYRALLLQAKPPAKPEENTSEVTIDGYFKNAFLFSYRPDIPDPADSADPANSTRNVKLGALSSLVPARIRELGTADNGHLLLTMETRTGTDTEDPPADPDTGAEPEESSPEFDVSLAYLAPQGSLKRLDTAAQICEQISSKPCSTSSGESP